MDIDGAMAMRTENNDYHYCGFGCSACKQTAINILVDELNRIYSQLCCPKCKEIHRP